MRRFICALALLGACAHGAALGDLEPRAQAQPAGKIAGLTAQVLERWGTPEMVLTGKLDEVVQGPTGMSEPPVYSFTLHVTVADVLRGNLEAGKSIALSHAVRQKKPPTFPVGRVCIVGVSRVRGHLRLDAIEVASADGIRQAQLACSVPIGWSVEADKLVCPWAKVGEKAWPKDAAVAGVTACAKTGRPALLVGKGVRFEVAPEPPEKEIKWTNPDGDGVYKIMVSNTTDKPVEVPALLTDGKEILWKESLLVVCQGETYTVPGCVGVSSKPKPVQLAPGEIAATTVNVLALRGPKWPQGGYRIEFQFCLGERSVRHSFYYMSRHHDRLREEAQKKLGGPG